VSDDSNIAPTNANLASCAPYSTWTSTAESQENLPVNCVNWYEAYAFCIWDGGFLPSEAEWEYAAAGGSQQREYPWGSTPSGLSVSYQYAVYGTGDPDGDGWTGCSNYPGGSCMTSGNFTDIAPVELTNEFGVDPLRYYLLRETALGKAWYGWMRQQNKSCVSGWTIDSRAMSASSP